MNGVHCQTRAVATAASGMSEIQSGCPGLSTPNSPANHAQAPFSRPYSGLYSTCFHISAAETGTSRKGVISSVRTKPRPMNSRSRRRARRSPSTTLTITTLAVSRTVVNTESRRLGSLNTSP